MEGRGPVCFFCGSMPTGISTNPQICSTNPSMEGFVEQMSGDLRKGMIVVKVMIIKMMMN